MIATLITLWLQGCNPIPEKRLLFSVSCPNSLKMITRVDWGWIAQTQTSPAHHIQFITIHHEGVDHEQKMDAKAYLRQFQQWCRQEKKWIDIPYHFMIDSAGIIYECRPIELPGDTNTDYDVRGHAQICLFGNFETIYPTNEQIEALAGLSACLANLYQVPLDRIKGHKDYTATACPGKNLYLYLQNGQLQYLIKSKMPGE
jgi:hypothetical protein